jgi:hypothetical protein
VAKKVKKQKAKPGLADDIRVSLREGLKYVCGEKADVIVHRVVASKSKARAARLALGLSQRDKTEPKAVRRVIAKSKPAA